MFRQQRQSSGPGAVLPRRGFLRRGPGKGRGQSLVEFALVIPLFVLLLVGIIEFAFALNGVLAINFAAREAALVAAEAGNGDGADCVILQKIENSVTSPSSTTNITSVLIFKTNSVGTKIATNTYVRTGSMSCTFPGSVVVTVPYSLTPAVSPPAFEPYEDTRRCNVLAGCKAPLPVTTGVDQIGVQISYNYTWRTPLSGILQLAGTGYTITGVSTMRMEPIL